MTRRRLSLALALGPALGLALGLSLALPRTAEAHRFRIQRTLMLEGWDDGSLHVVLAISVPGGKPRAGLLVAARSREAVERALAVRALDGLRLIVGTTTVSLPRMETKLRLPPEPDARVELMMHGATRLPDGEVAIRVKTARDGEPLELRVLEGRRPVIAAARGRRRDGGLELRLSAADQVDLRLAARPRPEGGAPGPRAE